jgi:hypothetical protein
LTSMRESPGWEARSSAVSNESLVNSTGSLAIPLAESSPLGDYHEKKQM